MEIGFLCSLIILVCLLRLSSETNYEDTCCLLETNFATRIIMEELRRKGRGFSPDQTFQNFRDIEISLTLRNSKETLKYQLIPTGPFATFDHQVNFKHFRTTDFEAPKL